MPYFLTFEQHEARKNICIKTLNAIENGSNLLQRATTCDESWVFTYDREIKPQSMHWKGPTSPRPKKATMSESKLKAMMLFSIFMEMYTFIGFQKVKLLTNIIIVGYCGYNVGEKIRNRRPELCEEKSCHLHQTMRPLILHCP